MNNLRDDILMLLKSTLSAEDTFDLECKLDILLNEYNFEHKSRELVSASDNNLTILKNFLGVKLLSGCSKATVDQYRLILGNALDRINKPVSDIDTQDIRYYLAEYGVTRQISTTSLNNIRSYFSSFFKWLCIEGVVSYNPIDRIPPFKEPKKHLPAFTDEELETLFDNCKNLRDRALVEFLYSTGCRVSECSAMNIEDIDMLHRTAMIHHGKGDKERVVYVTAKCVYHLRKYLNSRNDDQSCLFLGKRGRLTKEGIEHIVTNLGKACGFRAHPHKFRHTLATNLVKRNAPLHMVQKILGHTDISTTMIYVDTDDTQVKTMHSTLA